MTCYIWFIKACFTRFKQLPEIAQALLKNDENPQKKPKNVLKKL